MIDYKTRYGTHSANDDWRLWEFTRDTKLPRDTFDAPWWEQVRGDKVAVGVSLVAMVVGLLALWLEALL